MKLNGAYQFLVYADDVNKCKLGENINPINKNKETLLKAGIEANTYKTNYVVMSHHQNAGQNHNLLTDK